MTRRAPVALAFALILAGCLPGRGGRVEASWTGSDTGQIATEGTAQWCAAGMYVDIRASRGDTGFAVAIFPADTLVAGRYKLHDEPSDSVRPVASVAMRWSVQTSVYGFQSDSGTVVLRREPDGDVAGEVHAIGGVLGGEQRRLELRGGFRNLTLRPAPGGCPLLLNRPRLDFEDGSDLLQERLRSQSGRRGAAE